MSENTASRPAIHQFEQTYLGKLLLAAKVILEAAPDLSLVSDPLESTRAYSRTALDSRSCSREAAAVALPWRDIHNNAPRT